MSKALQIRNLTIGQGSPKIIVPIVGMTKEEIIDSAKDIKTAAPDIIEWRADWFKDVFDFDRVADVLRELRASYGDTPILFTFRTAKEGGEKAWLLKVALNRCRDLWRSSWIKKVVLGHPGFECFPAPDEIGQMADQQSLAEAVNRLKPEFKEVVLLFYYQGFNVTEIADMLQIAEGTVSSRLSRARDKLQKELKGDDQQ